MSLPEFERSAEWLKSHFTRLGFARGKGQALSIQYVGGEILTVPQSVLQAVVHHARRTFSETFDFVRDGVQSNLIGSPARISHLVSLFGDRIGTSVDHFGNQRTLSGSSEKYRTISIASIERVRRRSFNVPAIFVVDAKGADSAFDEFEKAQSDGYGLTLRAVFNGGRGVHEAPVEKIADLYGRIFDAWAMKSSYGVEPMRHLLTQRLGERGHLTGAQYFQGCPFQSNCSDVSLNLDPNGDLYICLDTSDSSQMRLGNALSGEFDEQLFSQIASRMEHLDASCKSCEYKGSCAGGCMSEGFHITGSPFGKTGLCLVWKTLFKKMDELIDAQGVAAVSQWLGALK